MTNSFINDIASSPLSSPATQLARRQRVEAALESVAPRDAPVPSAAETEALEPAIRRVNAALQPFGVEFDLGEDGSRTIIRIIDIATGDVIRQIPSEAALRVADRLDELRGLLLREQV
jgi:flagellar protein FlaG